MIPPKLNSHKEMQSWQRWLSIDWANKCEISDLLILILFYVTEYDEKHKEFPCNVYISQ